MKYKEKLSNFINDLDIQGLSFLGVQCCGTCASGSHVEKKHEKSFWISADDIDNKASVGVDLMLITNKPLSREEHLEILGLIMVTAKRNELSFYLSVGSYYRMGVYSKRGKQEMKYYSNGVEQINLCN